jgi:hypothetical protein
MVDVTVVILRVTKFKEEFLGQEMYQLVDMFWPDAYANCR